MVRSRVFLLSFSLFFSVKMVAQTKVDAAETYFEEKQKVASIYYLEGQLYADTALMMNPKNDEIWRERAIPYLKNGEFPAWITYINKSVALKPKTRLAYRGFCKAIFMKDYENALLDFDAEQALQGNEIYFMMDHSLQFFKSLCYLGLGKLDSARFFMQQSVDWQLKNKGLEWTHYVDLFYLGVIHYELNDITKAQYYIDQSLKKYPQFPDANYYKALILNKLGRKGEAMEHLITIEPNWKKGYRMNEDNEVYSNYPRQIGVGEVADLKAILAK